jgi:hypothetical protein
MAKSNCRKGFVEVPQMTLNALKGLLFGKEGVDLTSIIKDIAPDENDTDLTAINVGLVYNGLTPEIDKTTRFEQNYDSIVKYEFAGFSMIMGVVKVKRFERNYNHYGSDFGWRDWRECDGICCYDVSQWLEWGTDEKAVMQAIEKKYPKPQPQELAE